MQDFSYFVNKAMFDPKFAETLERDPKQALRDIGIEPTDAILKALEDIDTEQIQKLAAAFGGPTTAMP